MSTYLNDKHTHTTFYDCGLLANKEHVSVCASVYVCMLVCVHTSICMESSECIHAVKTFRKVYALSYCIPAIL